MCRLILEMSNKTHFYTEPSHCKGQTACEHACGEHEDICDVDFGQLENNVSTEEIIFIC